MPASMPLPAASAQQDRAVGVASRRRPRRGASGFAFFAALHRKRSGSPLRAMRGSRPSPGRARRPAASACRPSRRDPSSPGRNRPAGGRRQLRDCSARMSALACGQRRVDRVAAARRPARHCRRRPPPARRRRSRRWRRTYSRRCRAATQASAAVRKLSAMIARRRSRRMSSGCAPANSSRARPRPS